MMVSRPHAQQRRVSPVGQHRGFPILLRLLLLLLAQQSFPLMGRWVDPTAMLKASTAVVGFLLAPQDAQAQDKPVLTATDAGRSSVTLTWKAFPQIGHGGGFNNWYYRQKAAGGKYGKWIVISGPTFRIRTHTVTGLTIGTRYTFQVARGTLYSGSRTPTIHRSYSNTASATPSCMGLTATSSAYSVFLSWTSPTDADRSDFVLSYRKKGESSTISSTTIDNSETSWTIVQLEPETEYQFVLRSSNAEMGCPTSTPAQVTVTTTAAPVTTKTITLTTNQTNNRITEGDSGSKDVTVTATLGEAAPANFSVFIGFDLDNGTARGSDKGLNPCTPPLNPVDTDYCLPNTSVVSIAQGQTMGTQTVRIFGDTRNEENETIRLLSTALVSGWNPGRLTLTIVDDDNPSGVTISPTSLTVNEGSSETYTVMLDTMPSASVTVTVGGASGEVTVDGSPLTFGAASWNTAQTVTVKAGLDEDTDDDSTTLTHEASGSATGYNSSLSIDTVGVTVTDATPTLQLLTNPAAVKEGTFISLMVTSDKDLTGDLDVRLTLAARSSSNFDADDIPAPTLGPNNFTASFGSSGSKTGTVSIPTNLDSTTEGAENYSITLNNGTGYVVGNDATAAGTLNDAAANTPVLSASAGDGSVTLSWTIGRIDSAIGWFYQQKEGTGNYGAYQEIPGGRTKRSHTVTGLTNGTRYTFRVVRKWFPAFPYLPNKLGPESTEATATPTDLTATVTDTTPTLQLLTNPAAVKEGTFISLTVTSDKDLTGDLDVRLTLAARSSSNFDADDIPAPTLGPNNFTASFGSSGSKTGTVSIPTNLDSTTEGAENYSITLNNGTGYVVGNDATAAGTLNDAAANTPVLSASAGDGSVTLSWTIGRIDSAIGWFYQQKEGTGNYGAYQEIPGGRTKRSHTVTGLTNGTRYTFRVVRKWFPAFPYLPNKLGPESTEATATPMVASSVPGTPTGLTATAGDRQASLSWTDPEDGSISRYQYRQRKGSAAWGGWNNISGSNAETTSHTVTGLDNNERYRFQIRARNSSGNSPNSNTASATPQAVANPGVTITPKSVTVTEATGASQAKTYTVVLDTDPNATVTVTPVSSDPGAATVSAALIFTASNWDTAKTVTVTGVDDADRTNDLVTVSHTVTGYGSGASAVTTADSVTVTVTDDDVPAKPTVLSATAGNAQVTLNWSDPEDESITGYELRQKKGSAAWGDWSAIADSDDETVSHTVTGLDNDSRYRFRIRAVNSNGDGTQSDVKDATPTAPTTPGVTIDPTSLTVEEGSSGEYTVVLDTAPSASVTVTVAGTSGEVTVTGSPLTFSPTNWTTAKTVTVNAGADADATNDSATLTHSSASTDSNYGASLSSIDDVSVTVTDTTPTLQLLTDPAAVSEGENISLTVTSDMDLTGDVTVKLLLAARSSSSFDADDITGTLGPRDFTASFGSTGGKTGTVSIATSRDAVVESAENYRITLNDGSGYVVGTSKTADGTLNDGTIALSIGDVSAAEDGTFSFTVTASPTPSAPVTFKYKVTKESGDTAIAGTDFTAVSTATAKTIAANAASTTITVTVTDDDLDEPNETFTVTLSEPSVGVRLADATATGTITDDDNSPMLADIANETIKLGQAVDITATATDDDGDTITYAWSRKTGETIPAVPGSPSLNQARLTFTPAAVGTYTMTVTANDGNGNSDSEEVVITVTTASVVSVPTTVMVTEGTNSQARVIITTTDAFGEAVSFTVSYQDSTATGAATLSAGDYENDAVTTVTFNATDTSKNIDIPLNNDNKDEGDETFTVSVAGSLPSEYEFGNKTTTVTIKDNDPMPSLAIAAPSAVSEGDSGTTNMVFTVNLDAASGREVTVDYAVDTTSTASSGNDFTPLPSGTLTFAAGDTSKTITVAVTGDGVDEPNETVVLKLSDAGNATIGTATATATGTITDDDGEPSLAITVPSAVTEGDSGTTDMVFTVSLSPASGREVTVDYAVDSTSTASSGNDFTPLPSGTLTFTAGDTSKTITVAVTGDGVDEPNETVVLKLSDASNATIGTATATGTITDDDSSPVLADIANETIKLGQAVDITATATDGDSDTIAYVWTRKTGESVPAVPGSPSLNQARLTFTPAAVGTYTMTVTANDGNGNSDSEEVVITVTTASVVSVPTTVMVTEGTNSQARVIITTTDAFGEAVSFTVSYQDSTATGAATLSAGDYENDAVTTVTFNATDTSKNIDIPLNNDNKDEGDETFTVSVAGSLPSEYEFGNKTTTVTIKDNDPMPSLAIAAPSAVSEGDSGTTNMVFTVNLDAASGREVTVDYAVDTTSTASSGNDFTPLPSGTLTFAAGDTSKTITVAVTGDGVDEPNETVVLKLSDAGNATIGTATATATGTITDDDGEPSLAITVPSAVTEGDSGTTDMVFTVTLAPASGQQVTVDYAVDTTSTATSGSDFTPLPSGTLTFTAGDTSKTITVTVTGDTVDESNETVVLTLSNASNASIGTATATGTITDDDNTPVLADNAPVLADIANQSIKLGEAVSITASATDADGDTISYTWTRKAGETTPALPQGTALNAAQLNFTPVAVGTYTMTVTVNDGNGNMDTEEVVITVVNMDVVSVPGNLMVAESVGNATVRVTTTTAFGKALTFNITYGGSEARGDGTPANGDYDNDAVTTVNFSSTDRSKDIAIPVTDDDLDEDDETFTVNIALAPGNTLPDGFRLGNATTTVTITDDDESPVLVEITDKTISRGQAVDITASATDGDGDTVTYAWTRKAGETTPALPGSTALNQPRLTFTTTAVGTYTMTVTANDGNGNMDREEVVITVEASVTTVPGKPTGLMATPSGDGEVGLSWTKPTGPISSYEVRYGKTDSRDSAGGWAAIASSDATTVRHRVENLENGEEYSFQVRAINGSSHGAATDWVTATPQPPTAGVTVFPTTLSLREGGTTGSYKVLLNTDPSATVTVTPTSDDSGAVMVSAALTFNTSNWKTPQTVTVTTLQDADATNESVTVSHAVTGYGTVITADSVTVMVTDDETEDRPQVEVRKQELVGLSRATLGIATDMVGARVGGDLSGSSTGAGSIGDQALGVMENLLVSSNGSELSTNLSLEQLGEQLWNQSFHLSQSDSESEQQNWDITGVQGGRWSLWGAGELRSFQGNNDSDATDHSYSGSIKAGWLGVDYQFPNPWLTGLAVSFSSAESDYTYQSAESGTGAGKMKTQLTTFYPYGSVQLTERLKLWGTAGIGFGDLRHQDNDDDDSEDEGELKVHLGAIGFAQKLSPLASWNIFSLAGDLAFVQSSTKWQDGALNDQFVSITRTRLGVNSSFPLSQTTTGYMNLRGRLDGGDLQMGAVEMVLGLRYSTGRFSALLQGRQTSALNGTYSESGLLGELRFSSQQDGTGLALQLQPSYGPYGEVGGQQAPLTDDQQLDELTGWNGDGQPGGAMVLKSIMGYSFLLSEGNMLLTPFAEVAFTEGSRHQIGLGLSMEGHSWEVKLTGSREESSSTAPTGTVKVMFSKQL